MSNCTIQWKGNNRVEGTEGIIIIGNNIILGMQKEKRWYKLDEASKGAIIKTIGGSIEDVDDSNSKKALKREIIEEIDNINDEDVYIKDDKLFSKTIVMGDLNPFDTDSKMIMNADFYLVKIAEKKIFPKDLPALVVMPVMDFLNFEHNKKISINKIKKYLIINKKISILPEYFTFFIPLEVVKYLKEYVENNIIN